MLLQFNAYVLAALHDQHTSESVTQQLAFNSTIIMAGNKISVFRKEHFNAAHRLFIKDWSDVQNAAAFGKCSNLNYHGHNYELIVKVTGIPDAQTGFVIDLKKLSDIIKKEVLLKFDHKNLNLDVAEFKEINPTAENIAIVAYNLLRDKIDKSLDLKITLYETERNFVEYPA